MHHDAVREKLWRSQHFGSDSEGVHDRCTSLFPSLAHNPMLHHLEDTCHMLYTFILYHLEVLDQALLAYSYVPYWCAIGHTGDNQGIIDLAPVEEVESPYGVPEQVDPSYGRLGACCHYGDVVGPV
jgi:hypothetical protein